MRRIVEFACGDDVLFGTLDAAPGPFGLLIVSGGNEIRAGSWAGQAQLAAQVAAAGHPVFRYDRRGVGDSAGVNRDFRETRDDIAAAIAAFRTAAPGLRKIAGFGNCDAAGALMLFAASLQIDALVLANPWTVEGEDRAAQAPAALRRRYAAKFADPAAWKRLLGGAIDLRKLATGLRQAAATAPKSALAEQMREGLAQFGGPVDILLAERDRTAQLFTAAWGDDGRIARLASASHSFADQAARAWLLKRVLDALG
ncbi:hydrolase 1, exosortase A system-associated [Novosphingobium sp. Gsoil 351]|uniref:hydrolase 1, exosortase A system-associated n=1 Tax=Novosphingobium sp. Gsoil 351 TaxID=2675225 RepID=UPI0012B445B4|nr:hydrolase 1, exosortase A system-associated [Novosphingobium sp. Gsoil 351]QGN53202.1 hydrolase 1, exosortase A system-associated [Novosphingobium sp. Gsoil 351]